MCWWRFAICWGCSHLHVGLSLSPTHKNWQEVNSNYWQSSHILLLFDMYYMQAIWAHLFVSTFWHTLRITRDREQIVDITDTYSQACNITCGVPQGSILGPFLFLIYGNDMKAAVKCKLILYADDSAPAGLWQICAWVESSKRWMSGWRKTVYLYT